MNKRDAENGLRKRTLQRITNFLAKEGEDAQQTKTGTVMFPAIDELGNECFVTVTVQIPKGSRDGDPYDGYAEAENYRLETKQNEDKKIAKEIAKQKKIERDKKLREEKTKLKKEKETE